MVKVIRLNSFLKSVKKILSEETIEDLSCFLSENPTAGVVIKNSGGLRKVRWSIGNNKGTIGYIEIKGEDNVQKVLNKIYYLLDGEVKAHTYMSSWILRERHCGAYMIIHEITNLIPANCVFRPNFEWEAVKWDNNYNPYESKFKIGLYPYW